MGGGGFHSAFQGGFHSGFHGGFAPHAVAPRGGFGGHGGFGGAGFVHHGDFGGHHFVYGGRGTGHGFYHGGGHSFYHGRGHGFSHGYDHGTLVNVYGFGYGAPYYYYLPSYGYYDLAPDYECDLPPNECDSSVDESADQDAQADTYANQDTDTYYQVGYQWGLELKQYHLTVDQLATYLKTYILPSSPAQQAAFRSGFVASGAPDVAAVYDEALQEATGQS